MRELAERVPGGRFRCGRHGIRGAGSDHRDDQGEREAGHGRFHCAWRVLLPVGTFCVENHATPSRTRSNAMRYWAAVFGTRTIALTVTVAPGATAAGRAVRRPSHTYTFPLAA